MLKSLTLRKFQSHKRKTIEFSPGVNTIVGDNDTGKSAIIRALQLVCLNKLSRSPDAYIHNHKGSLVVELVVDGKRVVRKKGKGVNYYKLNGKRLEAFGKGKVPDEIEQLLNVGPENFQRQLDQHFWFSETAGEVSRRLNKMVNLGLVDSTLSNLASGLKEATSQVKFTLSSLKEAKDKLRSLAYVPLLDAKLKEAERTKGIADKTLSDAQNLGFLLKELSDMGNDRIAALNALQKGKETVRAGNEAIRAKQKWKRLKKLIEEVAEADNYSRVVIPDIQPLIKFRVSADALAERHRMLKFIIEDLETLEKQQWEVKGELEETGERLKKLSRSKNCPKCGQKLISSSSATSTCRHEPPSVEKRKGKSGTT